MNGMYYYCSSGISTANSSVRFVGNGLTTTLSSEDFEGINDFLKKCKVSPITTLCVRKFSKAVFNGTIYYSKEKKQKRRNSYTIAYFSPAGSILYGLIEKFFSVDDHSIVQIRKLATSVGPPHFIAETLITANSQKTIFGDYLSYSEGETGIIFVHHILSKCCNLSNNGRNILTLNVNDKLELM
jgi:hypothetical protein